ncbi:FAD-binding domain-containing protein [Apiospora aurea]|uniref:FAD-binding domain-containing protein n=1 Tax=Apiospora aurea TaxID=335848 RepID=A0ABR1QGI3_9PEZI
MGPYFPTEPWGSNTIRQASRLLPKSNWGAPSKPNAAFAAIRSIVEDGGYLVAFNLAANNPNKDAGAGMCPDNAVNPAWRDTVLHAAVVSL